MTEPSPEVLRELREHKVALEVAAETDRLIREREESLRPEGRSADALAHIARSLVRIADALERR
jgi:hypothetical protein